MRLILLIIFLENRNIVISECGTLFLFLYAYVSLYIVQDSGIPFKFHDNTVFSTDEFHQYKQYSLMKIIKFCNGFD